MVSSRAVVDIEDGYLVDRIKQDDEIAFKEIYNKYHKLLFIVSLRFLKSQELAKEVVQDVFIKIWVNRNHINTELNFKAYLFKIVKNHILNTLKRGAKETYIKQQIIQSTPIYNNVTEEFIDFSETEKIALAAIKQLPPQRKTIYKLCKEEGKSYEEVAEIMHISKGTVRDHMVKALRSIKQYFVLYSDININLMLVIFFFLKNIF